MSQISSWPLHHYSHPSLFSVEAKRLAEVKDRDRVHCGKC